MASVRDVLAARKERLLRRIDHLDAEKLRVQQEIADVNTAMATLNSPVEAIITKLTLLGVVKTED